MENHERFFKAQISVLGARNPGEINRERHRLARAKKRDDCFQKNREISLSPTPVKKQPVNNPQAIVEMTVEQENQQPTASPATSANKAMTKSERQKNYLEKFYAWKTASKKQSTRQPTTDVFVPPKRRSLYVLVDPKTIQASTSAAAIKKNNIVENFPAMTAAAAKPKTGVNMRPVTPAAATVKAKPTATAAAAARVKAVPAPVAPRVNPAPSIKVTNAATAANRKPPAIELATKRNPPAAVIRNVAKPKHAGTSTEPTATFQLKQTAPKANPTLVQKPKQTTDRGLIEGNAVRPLKVVSKPANLMTQPFERAPVANNIAKPIRSGGAAAKFKPAVAHNAHKKNTNSQLIMRMKAKKPAANHQKMINRVPDLKELEIEETSPITPLENAIPTMVTSTQYKSGNASANLFSESFRNVSNIGPLTASENRNSEELSATRQSPKETDTPKVARKFNFSRYSVANFLTESPDKNESTVVPPKEAVNGTGNDDEMTMLPQTPPPNADCAPNYLSRFVSVSRGKVNSQSEREKRNSMYLQEPDAEQPETPAPVRRTLATVSYFRMQLSKEIERLDLLCAKWQAYSTQNMEQLEMTGGKDMIDGAIGQTKLLSSKKLMQFKSLIDRCEAGATGKGQVPCDGSEATKPVLAEDLEGWWDMISLQSENVDKRFANLERWKANDWADPDVQEPPKPATNQLPKPKNKPKLASKPSSTLKSFLRKAYEAKRKNEYAAPTTDNLIQFDDTPSRRSRLIVVRDRKSFSPAKTVLRLSTGSGSRPSIANTLLKSAIKGAVEQKIRQQANTPPASVSRMSILKTPGTAKREHMASGVSFSVKKKVRRFQFTTEEDQLSDDDNVGHDKLEDCEEDMSLEKSTSSIGQQATSGMQGTGEEGNASRIYTLRNRRVKLRPSSEFM